MKLVVNFSFWLLFLQHLLYTIAAVYLHTSFHCNGSILQVINPSFKFGSSKLKIKLTLNPEGKVNSNQSDL